MKYAHTQELQEISLVEFMAALGYEPVYDYIIGLKGFYQPVFAFKGEQRVSVLRAIQMHNEEAEEQFAMLKLTPYEDFGVFVRKHANRQQINMIFAGTCKIVKKVKLSFSKRDGIILQSDNIEFATDVDRRRYEPSVLAE
jgi:hypothetical protein